MEKEKGAAEIRIILENSTLIVQRPSGAILHSRPAVAGDWSRLWAFLKPEPQNVEKATAVFEEQFLSQHPANQKLTPQALNAFFEQPGINLTGVCAEAGITKQYLNRCRKKNELPGPKVLDKLIPIMVKYGFKG